MLGKIEGKRRRGQQRIRWFDSITGSMDMNLHKLHDIVKDMDFTTEQQHDNTKFLSPSKHQIYIVTVL